MKFVKNGRTNIDVIPSIVTEELWVTLALVSASTPVLMRVAKKFTTSGIALGTTVASSSKSKEVSAHQRRTGFRPDNVTNSSHVDTQMMKGMGEGASIGSTAESHVGILRQVDFQVSSETKDREV
jgi:hypothetical protein